MKFCIGYKELSLLKYYDNNCHAKLFLYIAIVFLFVYRSNLLCTAICLKHSIVTLNKNWSFACNDDS